MLDAALHAADFTLVVPVFDEARRFDEYGPVIAEWVKAGAGARAVVFVDDGSTDGTADRVGAVLAAHPSAPLALVRRPHLGKGAAIAAGLAATTTPWAGFCDVDLSTPLPHVERVLAVARRTDALAIGSRDLPASQLIRPESRVREFLGRSYNRVVQAALAPGIVDTQCGAKAAPRHVWDAVLPHCREVGFAWDAELIAIARAVGIAVHEVPVDWIHDDRSGVRVGRDGLAMVLATPRIWRNARDLHRVPAAEAGDVFDEVNAERLMEADADHWWFRSKAALVSSGLRATTPPGRAWADGWLVDVGGGAGGVTAMLGWRDDRVLVLEGSAALVARARARHGLAATQATVGALPLADSSADAVCFLDVLEHLDDPGAALLEARRVLRPGGRLVITVPAHRWLWSEADELLGHVCRYTRPALAKLLTTAGFRPELLSHVFSWLVPPVWLTRRFGAEGEATLGLDRSSALLDRLALVLTRIERAVVRRASLPLGTSILCIATLDPGRSALGPGPAPVGRVGAGSEPAPS